jgi:hypothetical protein
VTLTFPKKEALSDTDMVEKQLFVSWTMCDCTSFLSQNNFTNIDIRNGMKGNISIESIFTFGMERVVK